MKRQEKTKIQGIARVKKFRADQDETTDEPVSITEKKFELTDEQAAAVKQGKTITITNNKVKVA